MGCVYSTPRRRPFFRRPTKQSPQHGPVDPDHNTNQRSFSVANVDDRGNEMNHGNIEITDTDLILHQKGKNSIFWPLRSLRRYGFDSELFSFECGRRCPTGSGIYAFRCSQAEQLFNVLQESIQQCNTTTASTSFINSTNITSPQHIAGVVSISSTPPTQLPDLNPRLPNSRVGSPPHHAYANEIHEYINSPFYVNTVTTSVLGTLTTPPPGISAPPLPVEGRRSATDINTNYAKLDDLVRYYVNIKTPNSLPPSLTINQANEVLPSLPSGSPPSPIKTISSQTESNHVIDTIAIDSDEPVNYIMLDLEPGNSPTGATIVTTAPATPLPKTPWSEENGAFFGNHCGPSPPGTPTSLVSSTSPCPYVNPMCTPQQYATIDFDKTVALSNSAANHRKQIPIAE